jgi:hypothetical protein
LATLFRCDRKADVDRPGKANIINQEVTKSCEAPHFQYHVSGVLKIRMDDGTEFEARPRDVTFLLAGHDAWVIGNEPAAVVDFQGMLDYAKSR